MTSEEYTHFCSFQKIKVEFFLFQVGFHVPFTEERLPSEESPDPWSVAVMAVLLEVSPQK